MRYISTLLMSSFLALAVGCGGSDGGDDPDPNPNPNPGGSGEGVAGVWVDPATAGKTTFVIDGNNTLTGFNSLGGTQYESLFGNIGGALNHFNHRDSDNQALGTSFTMVGDVADPATLTLSFATSNDDQTLTAGSYNLMRADENDMPTLALADVAGNWQAATAFCNGADCATLVMNLTLDGAGAVSGSTQYTEIDGTAYDAIPLTGTATSGGQYLAVNFTWNGVARSGVAYVDPASSAMVLNTIGLKAGTTDVMETLSARLTRQ